MITGLNLKLIVFAAMVTSIGGAAFWAKSIIETNAELKRELDQSNQTKTLLADTLSVSVANLGVKSIRGIECATSTNQYMGYHDKGFGSTWFSDEVKLIWRCDYTFTYGIKTDQPDWDWQASVDESTGVLTLGNVPYPSLLSKNVPNIDYEYEVIKAPSSRNKEFVREQINLIAKIRLIKSMKEDLKSGSLIMQTIKNSFKGQLLEIMNFGSKSGRSFTDVKIKFANNTEISVGPLRLTPDEIETYGQTTDFIKEYFKIDGFEIPEN